MSAVPLDARRGRARARAAARDRRRRADRAGDRRLPDGRALHGRPARVRDRARLRGRPAVRLRGAGRDPGRACSASAATSRSSPRSAREGELWRAATALFALAGFGFSAWLTYVEVVAARRDLHLVRRLGDLHDDPRGAGGGARAQRAAARPASVSVKTAGADAPQIPSGPQSASAEERTSPRPTASSTAQVSASRSGPPQPRVERVQRGRAAAERAQDLVGSAYSQCDARPGSS